MSMFAPLLEKLHRREDLSVDEAASALRSSMSETRLRRGEVSGAPDAVARPAGHAEVAALLTALGTMEIEMGPAHPHYGESLEKALHLKPKHVPALYQAGLTTRTGVRKQIWSRNSRDRYRNPGSPVMKRASTGHPVVVSNNGSIFLDGLILAIPNYAMLFGAMYLGGGFSGAGQGAGAADGPAGRARHGSAASSACQRKPSRSYAYVVCWSSPEYTENPDAALLR